MVVFCENIVRVIDNVYNVGYYRTPKECPLIQSKTTSHRKLSSQET